MMIPDLVIFIGILYAAGMLLLAFGATRLQLRSNGADLKRVSVIIAARNEEKNIRGCLESIVALRYPRELLEVIVVDDFSTDATGRIIGEFEKRFPFIRRLTPPETGDGLRGKVNALAAGIEQSSGDIMMFTDADCTVRPGWISRTVSYFADDTVAIVAGFADIRTSGLLSRVQALDWMMLLSAASATAALGFPVTAVGNNMAITRSAYERTGGYRKIPFSITEDLALFTAATNLRDARAVVPADPETIVTSDPCGSWGELLAQRKRWFVGGKGMAPSRVAAFGIGWVFNLILVTGLFYLSPVLWTGLILLKIMADILLILPSLAIFERGKLLITWIPFQAYFIAYVFLMPLAVIVSSRVRWKERVFQKEE